MNINLIDVIVLTHEEAQDIIKNNEPFDFDYLASGDYVVHAIYNENDDKILYLNDNIHGHPDTIIDGAEVGIRCCGATMTTEQMIVTLSEGQCAYNHTHVLSAIREVLGIYDDTVD